MEEYIVSARKYRPTSFDAVIGQRALTTTLKNAVKSGKLAHAYLFCGPRGVGKTTCARIFAKAINCENPTPDGEACGVCESCKASEEGRSYNLFELDAASNNSIEHIKQLMEQTRIPPQTGRYKVFIIDEVHMLSTAAFNAFLKTLEEPPAHVIFILATTEKQKILPTILSRCQIYDFERMSVANIVDHLKSVAAKEGITYDEQSLSLIAEKADGGMRDALSIFDQAASLCQGNITYEKVTEDLNVLDVDNYFNFVDLALENKVSDMLVLFNSIISKGFDPGNTILGLASHVRNLMLARDPVTLPMLEVGEQQRERFKQQAERCQPKFLFKALKIMNDCDNTYKQSSNKRLLAEITLIRVGQITQPDDDEPAAGRSPKRLKSLFIKTKALKPETAKQVAEATSADQSERKERNNQQHISSAPAGQPQRPQKNQLRLDNIAVTFGGILKKKEQEAEPLDEEIKPTGEGNSFSDDDVLEQWLAMCDRMQKARMAIAPRLRNLRPKITEFPNIEVVVDNQILLNQMMPIKNRLRKTLISSLHNENIELTLRLTEGKEVRKYVSKKDMVNELRHMNPAINRLIEEFDLYLEG